MAGRSGQAVKEKYGAAHYRAMGRKGGAATRDTHGREFYQEIGRKGANRVKELIARAREIEAEHGESATPG